VLDILVTMPAYNEEKCVGAVVSEIKEALQDEDHAVVVVSDGSTDGTIVEASLAGAVVCHKNHGGLADTFRYEMKVACQVWPRVIVHTDADGQFSATDIMRLVNEVKQGNDLVLGSRLRGNPEYMPKRRRVVNELGALGFRLWLQANITDATTGLRAFTPEVAMLPIRSDYSFTLEQLFRAKRAGFKIKSIPVDLWERRDGESKQVTSTPQYLWRTLLNVRRMTK